MPRATVISIDTQTSPSTANRSADRSSLADRPISVSFHSQVGEGGERFVVLEPHELYSFADGDDAVLFQALQLLSACITTLEAVQSLGSRADYLSFDELMMQLRAKLRSLFALRELGDGFAAVVNASLWSLRNKDTEMLDSRQVSAIAEAFRELRRKPLMHFDTAMSIVDQLEDAGLNVEPIMLDDLVSLV